MLNDPYSSNHILRRWLDSQNPPQPPNLRRWARSPRGYMVQSLQSLRLHPPRGAPATGQQRRWRVSRPGGVPEPSSPGASHVAELRGHGEQQRRRRFWGVEAPGVWFDLVTRTLRSIVNSSCEPIPQAGPCVLLWRLWGVHWFILRRTERTSRDVRGDEVRPRRSRSPDGATLLGPMEKAVAETASFDGCVDGIRLFELTELGCCGIDMFGLRACVFSMC